MSAPQQYEMTSPQGYPQQHPSGGSPQGGEYPPQGYPPQGGHPPGAHATPYPDNNPQGGYPQQQYPAQGGPPGGGPGYPQFVEDHAYVASLDSKARKKYEKKKRKKANAVIYFMQKRDKYQSEMKKIANTSPFACDCSSKKPRVWDCNACCIEFCCLGPLCYCNGCRIQMLTSDDPNCCTGCIKGCLLNICFGGTLRTELLELAGADKDKNSWGFNCFLHICCLPCAAAQEVAITNYYNRKRYGYKEEKPEKIAKRRAKQMKKPEHERKPVETMRYTREKKGAQGTPPYKMLTEWNQPQVAIAYRQKKYPEAAPITMQ